MLHNCLQKQKQTRKTKKHLGLSLLLCTPGFFICSCSQCDSHCDMFSDSISCSWDKLIFWWKAISNHSRKTSWLHFLPWSAWNMSGALDFCSGVEPGTPNDETRMSSLPQLLLWSLLLIVMSNSWCKKIKLMTPSRCLYHLWMCLNPPLWFSVKLLLLWYLVLIVFLSALFSMKSNVNAWKCQRRMPV